MVGGGGGAEPQADNTTSDARETPNETLTETLKDRERAAVRRQAQPAILPITSVFPSYERV
ncbi:hypothetical protein [Azospirillum doebereinerae]